MWMILLACRPGDPGGISEIDGVFRDGLGRQVVLRGVNARVDGVFDVDFDDGRTALETIPPFGAEDCRFLADELGFNLVRLPVNWSGIEPERDQIDDAYVDAVFAVVDDCYDAGVYTLIDVHQDAYGKDIGEDGAPLWAIVPPPTELLEGPLEDLQERRLSAQVRDAFASLYADEEGLHSEYADVGRVLAERMAAHPGAVGLELHNEPVPLGDQPGLDALHAAIADAARLADPDGLIVFEPDATRNLLDEMDVDGAFPFENTAYGPHLYTGVFTGNPGSAADVQASVDGMVREADAHGAALFIGEFGADVSTDEGMRWLGDALDAMDTANASWAYWVYEEWGQDQWGLYDSVDEERTELRSHVVSALARPYPQAVDGDLVSMVWDAPVLRVQIADAGRGEHVVGGVVGDAVVTCDGNVVDHVAEPGRVTFECAGTQIHVTVD